MSETVGPPTNNIGSGAIQGAGVGPKGEPGGKNALLKKKPLTRKIALKVSKWN